MRLTTEQGRFIAQSVRRHLGADSRIWLFGSRLDDSLRGGDLDLYVETPPHPLRNELRCKIELEESLDMPVDLIVRRSGDDSPIACITKNEGVSL
jgi:predicted nucleotidyltransferase